MYSYEYLGTTVLEVRQHGEYRRVFVREHGSDVEIGELTYGKLTRDVYDAPAHYHAIRLDFRAMAHGADALRQLVRGVGELGFIDLLVRYFSEQERFLADLLDDFDARGVRYGYLDTESDGRVTYRRSQSRRASGRPLLTFVT